MAYYHTTATTAGTMDTDVWYVWVSATSNSTTTVAGTTTGTAWVHWNENYYENAMNRAQAAPPPLNRLSESELRVTLQLRQQEDEEKARAEKLLDEHLTPEQRAQLKKEGGFDVEAQSGQKYWISKGRAGNVFSLDAYRKKKAKFCIHPDDYCPNADTMLAQALWLKWNEAEFLKIANRTEIAA